MNRFFTKSLVLVALVGAMTAYSTSKAEAAFTAYICNDVACAGGDDVIVNDDGVGDTVPIAGYIDFKAFNVNGYEIVANTSQSKPLLGSGMDLKYGVTNAAGGAVGGSVWLWAVDTDFSGPANLQAFLDGNTGLAGASVTAIVCGGNDNTTGPVDPTTDATCVWGTDATGVDHDIAFGFAASGNPYALAIGIQVSGVKAGDTATGDFRVVPEPVTLSLLGLGLAGVAARRRRQVK